MMVQPQSRSQAAVEGAARRLRLVLVGPPGAGKGTVAEVLSRRLGIEHWAMGDILRQTARAGGPTGAELQRYLDSGELVPDALVIRLLLGRMTAGGAWKTGFVLDGFPRTVEQARQLDAALQEHRLQLDLVLDFVTSLPVIIERLSGRRVCQRCGASYHVRNIPPKTAGVCDRCGDTLVQRADDREATIRHRLEIYNAESGPLVAYYRQRGVLEAVPGDGGVEPLYRELVTLFDCRTLVTPQERDNLLALKT